MLFSDSSTSVPDFPTFYSVVYLILGAIVAVLAIAHYVKQLFFSNKINEEDKPITRDEFREYKAEMKEQNAELLVARQRKLDDIYSQINSARLERAAQLLEMDKKVIAIHDYSHDAVHDVRDLISTCTNKISLLEQKIDVALQDWLKRLEGRLDHLDRGLGNLGSKVSQLIGRTGLRDPIRMNGNEEEHR